MKSIFPPLRPLARCVGALTLLVLIAGCGNKGPLVPPKALHALNTPASLALSLLGEAVC